MNLGVNYMEDTPENSVNYQDIAWLSESVIATMIFLEIEVGQFN